MANMDRPHLQLQKLVPKYSERIRNVARVDKEQIDYFKDENFDILQKSIEQMNKALLDAMLGKIEFGKDYMIRGEMRQEEDTSMNQIVLQQEMQINEFVKCKDCVHFVSEYGKGFCALGMLGRNLICSSDYCSYGERRENVKIH